MTQNDPVASALSKIHNAEKIGQKTVTLRQSSKLIKKVLTIMNEQGYVGSYEDGDHRSLIIHLLGKINKCGSVKPRSSVKNDEYEKFEKRHLPAKNFGIVIVSTSKGLMTFHDAKKLQLGGRLLAYCY